MSHPNKKRPEDRRTKRHMLLLTEAEHARYSRCAKSYGISLNEWIRSNLPKPVKGAVAKHALEILERPWPEGTMDGALVEDPTT